ncbi:sodium- and chloride-dependent GABA transporter 1-like [Penaeus monodon]|uniref:sodium- and chloride-dependent GABA transporter 1-like n=1 Tax=Penaeus monodon TaxID=6687 RepID=UPI0018A721A6|nr:sodium- and chloride-dependent GABA transporter 1-like [Penaeus monodon]XP_037777341.1 sodium- and chloride-dependent GABA transporter 1-like [Penaeus monodon]
MGQSPDESKERGHWSNKWDYLLSLAGYAIGIGNVWRFPYLCYRNGGGAFLIPYVIMLMLVGLPLFLLESAVGQFSSSSCLTLYSVAPAFKGIGFSSLLVTLIASTYYSVVVAYPLVYLFHSFSSQLPWASCDNYWNSPRCALSATTNFTNSTETAVSAADEFFHNRVLEISSNIDDPGGFVWPIVNTTLFVWTFVFLCVFRGVKVVGKVVWFTSSFPFLMLIILFIRGVTLPGAWDGIYYYIYPDFSKLGDLKVWADAAVQIFFSIGTGWGSLATMGSFNKFRNNCLRDALFVPVLNCATSFFAGFVVFSVLGFMAHKTGTSVESVTAAGPALAFITYPEALSLMPFAPLWSVLFFLMLFFLGIDSIFVQIENLVMSVVDEFPVLRTKKGWVTFAACGLMFLGALSCCTRGGLYVLLVLDWYSASVTVVFAGLCELIVFSYIYGAGRTVRDLQMMTKKAVGMFWYIAWIFVTPLLLLFIFINSMASMTAVSYRDVIFPSWAQSVGWLSALASFAGGPAYGIYYFLASKGSFSKRLVTGITPTSNWGPALEEHKAAWVEYVRSHPLRHRLLHPRFSPRAPSPAATSSPAEAKLLELHTSGGDSAARAGNPV